MVILLPLLAFVFATLVVTAMGLVGALLATLSARRTPVRSLDLIVCSYSGNTAAFAKELRTPIIAAGTEKEVVQINSSGVNLGVFTVTEGKTFLLTEVYIFPLNPGAGTDTIVIRQ